MALLARLVIHVWFVFTYEMEVTTIYVALVFGRDSNSDSLDVNRDFCEDIYMLTTFHKELVR